jgi:hypothetical protein
VGWGAIALGVAVQLAALAGVRSGDGRTMWFALLAVSGAAIAAGGLLVQSDPGVWSWVIAVPAGAALAVVHARVLFSAGGPFRT